MEPKREFGRSFVARWRAMFDVLSWRDLDFARVVLAGLVAGYVMAIAVVRHRDKTVIESVDAPGIDVVREEIEAPLWGVPPTL